MYQQQLHQTAHSTTPTPVAKLRTQKLTRPRPKTIHVESGSVDLSEASSLSSRGKKGSNSNLTGLGMHSASNTIRRDYYRGSQDSLAIREPATIERGRTLSRISLAKGANFRGRKSNSLMNLCGLPLDEQQENLNHWYCDRCLAVYRKSIEGGGGAECSPPSKTDKLIELVRKSGVEEAVKQQQQHGMMQHSQQLANRSEVKKHGGHRSSAASPGLKECLVNVFQRLTLESGAKSKAKAEPILHRQSFNAIRQRREEPPPVHDSDSGLGRATPPRRAPSPGMGPSSRHLPSPSGPGSLPPGLITKRRGFDDGSSDISSNASSMMDYNGPRLYKQPATKSNRGIILNAVEYCVFPGAVNRDAKQKVLEKIARSEAKHFLVLFRDAGCQFRALYGYWPENEQIIKLYGTGPSQVDDVMFDKFFKYNSGGKCFAQVHTKHLTVTIDAFTIHNSLWQGKKANLPSKKDMALVI
uniref:CKK domain-containing protein n=1 Tax=Anopheles melas TaxID=34690 RepID=A0A182UJ16_9DIPT